LLHWVDTRDWEKAFYAVIPKRKFLAGGTHKHDNNEAEEDEVVDVISCEDQE
jgi:hypothetical protein